MSELAIKEGFKNPNSLKKEINKLKKFEYFTVKTREDIERLASESKGNIFYYYRVQGVNKHKAISTALEIVAPKEYLYERYHNQGMTAKEITEEIGLWIFSEEAIKRRIERLKITHKKDTNRDIYKRSWAKKGVRLEKIKNTNRSRYGVDYTTQTSSMKEKTKQTMLSRYGVEHPLQHKDFYEKAQKTIDRRYKNPESGEFIGYKVSSEWHKTPYVSTFKEALDLIQPNSKGESTKLNKLLTKLLKDGSFNYITLKTLADDIVGLPRWYYTNPPYNIHPDGNLIVSNYRGEQTELVEFIVSLGIPNNEIIVDKFYDFMGGKQLDIYIPKYSFAIEFNGTFWHATEGSGIANPKDKCYHRDKTKRANQEGIELMHVWDFEWRETNTREIIKSQIRHRIEKDEHKCYARSTCVRKVNLIDSNIFLERTNREGTVERGESYGLYYDNKLVALMTVDDKMQTTTTTTNYLKILRFSTELNTAVVGGFSKLISHIIKDKVNLKYILVNEPLDYTRLHTSITSNLLELDEYYEYQDSGKWASQKSSTGYMNKHDKSRRYKIYDSGRTISIYRVNRRGV